MKIDLVLQGPVYSYTGDIIRSYLQHPLTERVILSCWEACNTESLESIDRLTIIKNKDVTYPGVGNINRQITSSYSGLTKSSNPYTAKMRTDQLFSQEALSTMHRFFNTFSKPEGKYLDGSRRLGKIFVLGMYSRFPFHPRDHVFWGYREDLLKLFSIPKASPLKVMTTAQQDSSDYWTQVTRPECYLGTWYASLVDERVVPLFSDYENFLPDSSPNLTAALNLSAELRDQVFSPFPRIDFSWPKHGLKSYHFHVGESLSEYWYQGDWK